MTPGPTPIGALGRELLGLIEPLTARVVTGAVLGAILVVALVLAPVVLDLAPALGYVGAIALFGLGAALVLTATVAAVAFLPPLLVRGDDRTALAVHSWIGARETRRAFGRASGAADALGSPEAAARWLEGAPRDDAHAHVRFEALLFLGRHEEARRVAESLPERSPLETYRKEEAQALVEELSGRPFDEGRLREAVARIPRGIDRTEAAVSLAVALARRGIPAGWWRRPLLDVRHLIEESDLVLLTRDMGLTTFELLGRRVLLPLLLLLLGLSIVLAAAPAFVR